MADYAIFGVTIADVAQLDRAFGYEPKGSRFESWHPQKKAPLDKRGVFSYKAEFGAKNLEPSSFCR